MAMTKPSLQNTVAFDKNDGNTFYFTSTGGNQVVKNKLTIRNNITNVVVYQEIVETYRFDHTLPSNNNLVNGVQYNAYINTYDVNGNESPNSNQIVFYCYTTPSLTIDNLPYDNIVENSSYVFDVKYNQLENELLDSIIISLYDIQNKLIQQSKKLYSQDEPPLVISYEFSGFTDDTSYNLQIDGITEEGTIIQSELYEIFINYIAPSAFSSLVLENDCNNGYVKITSNLKIVEGRTNFEPVYINDEVLEISTGEELCAFIDGFSLRDDYTISIRMSPLDINKIYSMYKNKNNRFDISFAREIPYGMNVYKDYFILQGYENGELKVNQKSNYIDPMNTLETVVVWVQKNGNDYELILDSLEHTDNFIEWNGESNVEWNCFTEIQYEGEVDTSTSAFISKNENINIYPIDNVEIYRGRYDQFYLTQDNTIDFTAEKFTNDDWDNDTQILAQFEGNLIAGNADFILSQIPRFKIKRREVNTFNWITIFEKTVDEPSDMVVQIIDSLLPSNVEFEYALVPMLADGTEGDYIQEKVLSKFNGSYITDLDKIFKLSSNVTNDTMRNQIKGVLNPIGARVPFFIKNSDNNYDTGTFSADVLGEVGATHTVNRYEVQVTTQEMKDFLTDGNAKIVKDWNGNICLCEIVDNINVTQNLLTGICNISFSYAEQGKYDNEQDLYDYGLLRVGE